VYGIVYFHPHLVEDFDALVDRRPPRPEQLAWRASRRQRKEGRRPLRGAEGPGSESTP
jgi:hypothetical protein